MVPFARVQVWLSRLRRLAFSSRHSHFRTSLAYITSSRLVHSSLLQGVVKCWTCKQRTHVTECKLSRGMLLSSVVLAGEKIFLHFCFGSKRLSSTPDHMQEAQQTRSYTILCAAP